MLRNELVEYIKRAEKLKTELRHSWLSNPERQESVAEHSWMMALIAMSVFDKIAIEVDQLKVMKLIIINDLAEAIIGDIPAFATEQRVGRYAKEQAAMAPRKLGSVPSKTIASLDTK